MYSWFNLTGDGEPERVTSGIGSASFFNLVGAHPLAGRLFLAEEDRPGGPPVVILSESLWRSRYKGDRSIIGRGITLDGKLHTVVGVLPATFVIPDRFPAEYALWVPLAVGPTGLPFSVVRVIGRLKPGVSLAASRAELDAMIQPALRGRLKKTIVLSRWHDQITEHSRLSLLLFLGAVGLLLLIACVNVANLMLLRAASRQKEMAIRLTVGAGKRRVVRQLLTESAILAVIGALVGLVFAQWGKGLLISFISPNLPALEPISLDYRGLLFTVGVAVATGLAFGLAPALQVTGVSLNEVLKEAARSTSEMRFGGLMRNLLVICETAQAMVLLVGSGLLYRTFLRARGIDPGFQSDHMLTLTLDLTTAKYPKPEDQANFFERLIDSLKRIEGVQSVGGSSCPPIGGRSAGVSGAIIEGRSEEGPISYDMVSPDYFRTMHIPLRKGRFFADSDRVGSPGVAIVNESFARRYFPGEICLGRRLHSWIHKTDMLAIVGVVGDVRAGWEREPDPEIYIPYQQGPQPFMALLVHTSGNPMRVVPAIRSQVAAIDKDQPLHDIATLEEIHAKSLTPRRVNMLLLGAFAAMGLILASVGVYGVVSYSVSQRTHEIGIRMALGADRSDVLRGMIWQGFRPVLVGAVIGVAASLALTRFMLTLLFGIKPTDPTTFFAVALILAAAALLATYLPARRATKVDPMVALRYE
jgi:putative ABC transport system permease protein